jgi:hypothetical protein
MGCDGSDGAEICRVLMAALMAAQTTATPTPRFCALLERLKYELEDFRIRL